MFNRGLLSGILIIFKVYLTVDCSQTLVLILFYFTFLSYYCTFYYIQYLFINIFVIFFILLLHQTFIYFYFFSCFLLRQTLIYVLFDLNLISFSSWLFLPDLHFYLTLVLNFPILRFNSFHEWFSDHFPCCFWPSLNPPDFINEMLTELLWGIISFL